jgi:two-component system NtrC family sensor kinase
MKNLLKSALILLLPIFGWGQDSVVNITPGKFTKDINAFFIDAAEGWVFHNGNDTNWSKKNIDTKGWEKLKPTDLLAKYADKNGRVEGWFRIKVTFDSSLLNKVLYVDFGQWAATAFYVDGELVAARGNTGEKGKGFREYLGGLDPLSMHFNVSGPHILSLHYVGYLSAIPPHEVKTQFREHVMLIAGPNFTTLLRKVKETSYFFQTLYLVVCAILSVLFWLLLFQNPKEKILFWTAFFTSTFAITMWCDLCRIDINGSSYYVDKSVRLISVFLASCTFLLLLPILLSKVLKRKINRRLILSLIILIVVNEIGAFVTSSFSTAFEYIYVFSYIFVLGICLYYVITSWKNLMGAQWAIVVGLIFTALILSFGLIFYPVIKSALTYYIIVSLVDLSFPLSLMIYVSMRFKEMIHEVQENAEKVVELSEEKKVQAETQQKVLEEEVTRQTREIRQTLENLKTTQSQLIQSEKMASLGELTAGIAHEIQNPLNFVNNFSEVNTELIDELKQEMDKGNLEDARAIADDIKENEEKINHHGKRADAIVKGMLQHSRSNSGVKEPTDINALADEYLRLAYHGLRAKDKEFNATLITDFDDSIGMINMIPQDIGRVILNLITNAFYAVAEKKKQSGDGYEPTVTVTTKRIVPLPGGPQGVEVRVADNGNGIPPKILDKIFQPFFTTKPTGQGTGLGLSLSYDIVKAHGGELKVETKENEGTEFIIQLPI